jgi:hypothetical protein
MRDHRRISLIVFLAVLGGGAAAHAQPSGHFDRVTTTAQGDAKSTSKVNRVATAGATAAARKTVARADSLRPFSAQKVAQAKASASQTPGSSSWHQEPQRPAAPRPAVAPSQPHTYYPGLRAGRALQQPVKLTARRAAMIPPIGVTPSRNQVPAGAGRHR